MRIDDIKPDDRLARDLWRPEVGWYIRVIAVERHTWPGATRAVRSVWGIPTDAETGEPVHYDPDGDKAPAGTPGAVPAGPGWYRARDLTPFEPVAAEARRRAEVEDAREARAEQIRSALTGAGLDDPEVRYRTGWTIRLYEDDVDHLIACLAALRDVNPQLSSPGIRPGDAPRP